MIDNTIEKKKLIKLICPACDSPTHTWRDVYFDSGTVLKKAEKQYISWCSDTKQFVLSAIRITPN